MLNPEEVLTALSKQVRDNPAYLKTLEKNLDSITYRVLLAWMELDKSEAILNNIPDSISDDEFQKCMDGLTKSKHIHEQVEAEISSLKSEPQ